MDQRRHQHGKEKALALKADTLSFLEISWTPNSLFTPGHIYTLISGFALLFSVFLISWLVMKLNNLLIFLWPWVHQSLEFLLWLWSLVSKTSPEPQFRQDYRPSWRGPFPPDILWLACCSVSSMYQQNFPISMGKRETGIDQSCHYVNNVHKN